MSFVAMVFILAGVAIYIRTRLMLVIPDPIFHADSLSYYGPALDLLYNGTFNVHDARTPAYPYLVYLLLKFFRSFTGVIVVQHLLSMGVAVMSALIYFFGFERSKMRALIAGFFVSLLPGQLTFAHTIMNDMPYSFFLILSLFMFFTLRNKQSQLGWLVAGACSGLATLVRPVALSLVLAFMLAPFLYCKRRVLISSVVIFWVGFGAVITPHCAWNFRHRGYWGLSKWEGMALFGNTAYLLDVEAVEDNRIEEVLRPIYNLRRDELPESNWVRFNKSGPVEAIRRAQLVPENDLDDLLKHLAFQTIRLHPVRLLLDKSWDVVDFIRNRSSGPQYIFSKEFTVMGGFMLFASSNPHLPRAWELLRFHPENEESYYEFLQAQPLYPFEFRGASEIFFLLIPVLLAIIPSMSILLGGLLLVNDNRRREIIFLLSIILFHVTLTVMGTDHKTPRHAIPIEPLYVILFVYAINHQRLKEAFYSIASFGRSFLAKIANA